MISHAQLGTTLKFSGCVVGTRNPYIDVHSFAIYATVGENFWQRCSFLKVPKSFSLFETPESSRPSSTPAFSEPQVKIWLQGRYTSITMIHPQPSWKKHRNGTRLQNINLRWSTKNTFFWCPFFEGSLKKHISNTTKRLGPHLPDLNLTMKLGPDVEKVNMLFRAKENEWLEDEISFWDGLFFKGTTLPPISNVQWNMGYLEYEFPFIPGYFRLWWLGENGYLLLVVEPSWKTSLSNLSSEGGWKLHDKAWRTSTTSHCQQLLGSIF